MADDTLWPLWLLVGLLAVVAVGLGWLAVHVVRRRHPREDTRARRLHARRVRAWLVAPVSWLLSVVCAVLAVGIVVGVHFGYLTGWASLAGTVGSVVDSDPIPLPSGRPAVPATETTASTGVVFQETIRSSATGVPSSLTTIYVPPGYSQHPDATYPVIYLMHGAPGLGPDWFDAGDINARLDTLIAAGTMPPAIVIAPDLDLSADDEPVDYPGNGAKRGTFMITDVVSWTDEHLRTVADPDHRILGGMSAGGYGAVIDALRTPATWNGVMAAMPYLHPAASALADPSTAAAEIPTSAIPAAGDLTGRFFYLGYVSSEGPSEATTIGQLLQAQGATVQVSGVTGKHDWKSAPEIAVAGLPWLAQQLGWTAPS